MLPLSVLLAASTVTAAGVHRGPGDVPALPPPGGPEAHSRITVENLAGGRIGAPSALAFSIYSDDRGEEKDIYAWRADGATDALRLTRFDRTVLSMSRGAEDTAARHAHLAARKRVLEATPVALDTSASDHGTNEGGIGKFADRPLADTIAASVGQAPYQDADDDGLIMAHDLTATGSFHNDGMVLLVPSGDVIVGGVAQWKLVVEERFDRAGPQGWTAFSAHAQAASNARGRCGPNVTPRTDWFLGPYTSAEVTKSFELPPDHTRVKVRANFHFLDDWDDQIAYMKLNGKIVWQRAHTMCGTYSIIPDIRALCLAKGVNACGSDGVDAMGVLIQHELEYFSGKLDVTFGATLEKDNGAAWGVDDLQLFVL